MSPISARRSRTISGSAWAPSSALAASKEALGSRCASRSARWRSRKRARQLNAERLARAAGGSPGRLAEEESELRSDWQAEARPTKTCPQEWGRPIGHAWKATLLTFQLLRRAVEFLERRLLHGLRQIGAPRLQAQADGPRRRRAQMAVHCFARRIQRRVALDRHGGAPQAVQPSLVKA